MSKRLMAFSDLTATLIPEGEHAEIRVTLPEGHRKAGTHKFDAAKHELDPLLGKTAPRLARIAVRYPDGSKPPRTMTLPVADVEKVLGEALISVDARGTASPRSGTRNRRTPATEVAAQIMPVLAKNRANDGWMIVSEVNAELPSFSSSQIGNGLKLMVAEKSIKTRQRTGAFPGGSATEYHVVK